MRLALTRERWGTALGDAMRSRYTAGMGWKEIGSLETNEEGLAGWME